MAKSEIRDKQICLPSIIFEVAKSRDKLWKTVRLDSFQKPNQSIRFSLLQFCPSVASVVSVVLFWPSFNVFSGYFYVSLRFTGHFVIPNLAEFRDTAPLKGLRLEIYQNSNRGNCQQTGWNIKINANTAKTEGSMDGQTRRRFKQIAFVFWKLVRLTVWQRFFVVVCNDWYNACETHFVWHKAVILSFTTGFSSKDA